MQTASVAHMQTHRWWAHATPTQRSPTSLSEVEASEELGASASGKFGPPSPYFSSLETGRTGGESGEIQRSASLDASSSASSCSPTPAYPSSPSRTPTVPLIEEREIKESQAQKRAEIQAYFRMRSALRDPVLSGAKKYIALDFVDERTLTEDQRYILNNPGVQKYIDKGLLTIDQVLIPGLTDAQLYNLNHPTVQKYIDNELIKIGDAIALSDQSRRNLNTPGVQKYIDYKLITIEQAIALSEEARSSLDDPHVQTCIDKRFLKIERIINRHIEIVLCPWKEDYYKLIDSKKKDKIGLMPSLLRSIFSFLISITD